MPWPLDHIAVELAHGRRHADDGRDCATQPCSIDRFERTIQLEGRLSDDQRSDLLAIAEKGPVHQPLLILAALGLGSARGDRAGSVGLQPHSCR